MSFTIKIQLTLNINTFQYFWYFFSLTYSFIFYIYLLYLSIFFSFLLVFLNWCFRLRAVKCDQFFQGAKANFVDFIQKTVPSFINWWALFSIKKIKFNNYFMNHSVIMFFWKNVPLIIYFHDISISSTLTFTTFVSFYNNKLPYQPSSVTEFGTLSNWKQTW